MPNPRHLGSAVLVSSLLYLSLLIVGVPGYVRAQQPESSKGTARGIQLYQQGDAAGAIKVLGEVVEKHPDDADAWYYLGLAFNSQGLISEARSRFEHLINLRPDSADGHAKLAYALILANEPQKAIAIAQRAIELGDRSPEAHYAIAEASFRMDSPEKAAEEAGAALMINPDFLPALITKSLAQLRLKQYSEAEACLERFLAISPDDVDAETWRGQLEELPNRTHEPLKPAPLVVPAKELTQKARVLSKPEPQYTEQARKAGVQGTIVLRAIFTASGEVKHILVTRAVGYGLTTEAIKAACQIKFEPAIKDGRPVSMYIQLEYNFHLY